MRDPLFIELPTRIDTERLLMRPPQAGDGPQFFEALSESLAELRRFLSALAWVAAEPSLEASELYCRTGQANFVARKDLPFFLFERASGQLVGATGLHRTAWGTPKTEVGYWVRSSRSGQGLMAEAVEATTRYAFAHIGAVRVELITDAANQASRKVADRCGFRLEGTLVHDRRAPDGSLRSTCIYARFPPTC
ncbi:MAG TPA: GNAT family N-acetyltransferase [Burkholderiaceae bacterium]|nr:GNAT family N-acetyltransferase [Burkholderiaceae bacterium]